MTTLREVFITELTTAVHGDPVEHMHIHPSVLTHAHPLPGTAALTEEDIEALADRLLQILHIHGKILGPLDYIDAEDPPWHF